MKFETHTRSPLWLLQKGSVSRLFDVTVTDAPSHHRIFVAGFLSFSGRTSGSFLFVRTELQIRNVHGRDRRCNTVDADEMWTQSSGILTFLVAIRCEKTCTMK